MEDSPLFIVIPLVAIIMGCSIPLLAIYADYRKRREFFMLHHQERMAAIEKGLALPPVPDSLFNEASGEPKSPHSDYGSGLFWFLAGAALFVALFFHRNPKVALYSLIPIAIGLHYLIYYYAVGKKEAIALEAERRAKAAEASQIEVSN